MSTPGATGGLSASVSTATIPHFIPKLIHWQASCQWHRYAPVSPLRGHFRHRTHVIFVAIPPKFRDALAFPVSFRMMFPRIRNDHANYLRSVPGAA